MEIVTLKTEIRLGIQICFRFDGQSKIDKGTNNEHERELSVGNA